ncbi:MAG: hypothetical protein LBN40_01395 [Oscillospiraceae bacterium]|jgi:hypothetical protein|nr:hypothetical protein [Oscillospiraceae bacterium]
MNSILFITRSQTDAQRARVYLARNGISSVVEKTTFKRGGCAFGVRVRGDSSNCAEILARYGIVIIETRT